jgi:2',3'-cyclic-nucleotide 2'-phosphodiesterase/3'-nucleotidase
VLFDTGPAANAYLDLIDINIEEAGDGPDGFARFWITL